MCGITAIYSYRTGSSLVDPRELAKISDQMAARGPDGEGSWISADKKIGFANFSSFQFNCLNVPAA